MINWLADEQAQTQGFGLDLDDVKLTRMISRLIRVRKQGPCFFYLDIKLRFRGHQLFCWPLPVHILVLKISQSPGIKR